MATSIGVPGGAPSADPEGRTPSVIETEDPIVGELTLEAVTLDESEETSINLVAYLQNVWGTNREHKSRVDVKEQMLRNQRARDEEYEPEDLAKIKAQGLPDVFMGITGVKCRAAVAWILDIFTSREQTWEIEPTPDPDYSASVIAQTSNQVLQAVQEQLEEATDPQQLEEDSKREAKKIFDAEIAKRAEKMQVKISDQLFEGGFWEAFDTFVDDLVTLKAAVIKGPIIRVRKRRTWVTDPETDEVFEEVVNTAVPEYESVSPHDLYPSPNATNENEGSIVEVLKLQRKDLVALKDQPGYRNDEIDAVLDDFFAIRGMNQDHELEADREDIQLRDHKDEAPIAEDIEGLEFYLRVQGKLLKEQGFKKDPDDEKIEDLAEYDVNAILVGSKLIYLDFNDDPLGERPYSVCGWEKKAGSFWYRGVPELIGSLQRISNGAVRSLVYNLSIASGPQAEVDVSRLLGGEDEEAMFAGKIWQINGTGSHGSPAVRWFQPEIRSAELLGVHDRMTQLADDYTGIPAYAYGNDDVAGAGRTASGLSALMSNAARGIKRVMVSIHMKVLAPVILRQFNWNMRHLSNDFRGDARVKPVGLVALMVREQLAERRTQFLTSTQNETDMEILGVAGRVKALRATADSLEIDDLVPSDDEIEERQQQREALQQQQAQAQAQAQQLEMQEAQIKAQQAMASVQKVEAEINKLRVESELQVAEFELKREVEIAKAEATGIELEIKGERVSAEANKDNAVAADLALRNLTDAQNNESTGGIQGNAETESSAP